MLFSGGYFVLFGMTGLVFSDRSFASLRMTGGIRMAGDIRMAGRLKMARSAGVP